MAAAFEMIDLCGSSDDEAEPPQTPSGPLSAELQQLAQIVGPALSADQQRRLLERAGGDVQQALSAYLDEGGAAFAEPGPPVLPPRAEVNLVKPEALPAAATVDSTDVDCVTYVPTPAHKRASVAATPVQSPGDEDVVVTGVDDPTLSMAHARCDTMSLFRRSKVTGTTRYLHESRV
jgi:hypothetical protein